MENVFLKPDYLTWEKARALPLASLAAYRVLYRKMPFASQFLSHSTVEVSQGMRTDKRTNLKSYFEQRDKSFKS